MRRHALSAAVRIDVSVRPIGGVGALPLARISVKAGQRPILQTSTPSPFSEKSLSRYVSAGLAGSALHDCPTVQGVHLQAYVPRLRIPHGKRSEIRLCILDWTQIFLSIQTMNWYILVYG